MAARKEEEVRRKVLAMTGKGKEQELANSQ